MLINQTHSNEIRHLLAIIRRASKDNCSVITLSKNKFYYKSILKILYQEGFIQSFEERGNFLLIRLKRIYWKYRKNFTSAIQNITKIKRIYKKHVFTSKKLSKMSWLEGEAIFHIFSTNKGIILGKKASKKNLGGIPIIKIA